MFGFIHHGNLNRCFEKLLYVYRFKFVVTGLYRKKLLEAEVIITRLLDLRWRYSASHAMREQIGKLPCVKATVYRRGWSVSALER
jgi:hypothetical protein